MLITIDNERKTANEIYKLAEKLLLPDMINCGRNEVGLGFPPLVAEKVVECINLDLEKKQTFLLINDITLNMYNKLVESGVDKNNIYLTFIYFTKNEKNKLRYDDKKLYNIVREYLLSQYKETFSCVTFEEAKSMKFDYIINNPPFGKSGSMSAKITRGIMDNLNYNQLINLAPSSTYINGDKTIYKNISYISDKIPGLFDNALTDPCVAVIENKAVSNYATVRDFEVNTIFNPIFRKYFNENLKRDSVIEKHLCNKDASQVSQMVDSETSFITGIFVTHDGVHDLNNAESIGEKLWNIDLVNQPTNEIFKSTRGNNKSLTITIFKGSTREEQRIKKINFSNWFYSAQLANKPYKCGLATKLLHAMNTTTSRPYSIIIPNVDWSKPWTDEEILKDFGYTDDEIKSILCDNEL